MHLIYMPRNTGAIPGKVIKPLINFIMNDLKKLSRAEMRNVKGGVDAPPGTQCTAECKIDTDCGANKHCSVITCEGKYDIRICFAD
jgi:hypothetical protein